MTQQAALIHNPDRGVWLGASYALGRLVPIDETYPHICGSTVDGRMTPGLTVKLWRRDCAACIQERAEQPPERPPATDEHRAIEARRLGERD